jgi:hypothetical protein
MIDSYPFFLAAMLKPPNLTPDSILYTTLALSKIIDKDHEFARILDDLEVIKELLEKYNEWNKESARLGLVTFLMSLLNAREEEYTHKLMRVSDFREIYLALSSTEASLATIAMEFMTRTLPWIVPKLIEAANGQFWHILDAIVASLCRNREEQVLAACRALRGLAKCSSKEMVCRFNGEFNDAIVRLLRSDVRVYQEEILCFFDVILATGDVALGQLNNWCFEFQDAGGNEGLIGVRDCGEKKYSKHARAVMAKIESIQRAHRGRHGN